MFHVPAHLNTQSPAAQVRPGLADLHAMCDAQNGPQPDFRVWHDVPKNHPVTVYMVQPLSEAARSWCEDHLRDAGRWCGSYSIDHRMIGHVVDGMEDDGLTRHAA